MGRPLGIRATMWRVLLVAPLLAAAVALGSPAPASAAYACIGVVGGTSIKENVVVPTNEHCFLNGTVVRGSVTVEAGATLVTSDADIRGSVTATEHERLAVNGGVVRGSVTAIGGTDVTDLLETEIRGNVYLGFNGGFYAGVFSSTVRGSVTIEGNIVSFETYVGDSTISANLSCAGNTPAPTNYGDPNVVGGSASGECVGL